MYYIDDLMLFINSLDSTTFSIDNVICEDQKQYVLEAYEASFGLNRSSEFLGCWVEFLHVLEKTVS